MKYSILSYLLYYLILIDRIFCRISGIQHKPDIRYPALNIYRFSCKITIRHIPKPKVSSLPFCSRRRCCRVRRRRLNRRLLWLQPLTEVGVAAPTPSHSTHSHTHSTLAQHSSTRRQSTTRTTSCRPP